MEKREKGFRKEKTGVVISNKMQNTVVVLVTRTMRHPLYEKVVQRKKKYYAHDKTNGLEVGAKVTIKETRPLSKLKRWTVV